MKKILLGLFIFSFLFFGFEFASATIVYQPTINIDSPNGGELLKIGEKKEIEWKYFSTTDDNEIVSYIVSLQPVCVPPDNGSCTAVVPNPYVIGTVDSSDDSPHYDWMVGKVIKDNSFIFVPESTYKIKVCTTVDNCDYSDDYFTIISSSVSNIPVISGIKGPQTLKVDQKGEWEVKVSNSNDEDSLSYSVVWGDEVDQINNLTTTKQAFQQRATFTHSYMAVGTYKPTFTVTNSSGKTAETSISVIVTNSRVEPPKPIDNGCLPGFKYSVKTGKLCSDTLVIDGCMPGYKFNPMTGLVCPKIVENEIEQKKSCTEPGSNCGVRNYGISRILKHGIKGEDVKILQSLLNLVQDGSFGPMTKQKLMEWQAQNGLTPDGVFGNQSRHKAGFDD